jgi:hypothetical protein
MAAMKIAMRLACCALASLLAACPEPPPPVAPPKPKVAYYQDFNVSDRPLGFRLANEIDPLKADAKRFFWKAHNDAEGRIVVLETYAPPMCLQSRHSLTYDGTGTEPVKRQRQPASDCKPAKTF